MTPRGHVTREDNLQRALCRVAELVNTLESTIEDNRQLQVTATLNKEAAKSRARKSSDRDDTGSKAGSQLESCDLHHHHSDQHSTQSTKVTNAKGYR